jgi:hypothetical protein
MRIVRLVSVLVAVATALVAASPYVGTWKLDPAKSKYKKGSPPKEQTFEITESGANLDVVVKGTAAGGTPISSHIVVPAAGGPGKIVDGPSAYDGVSNKRMSESERETSYHKGSKVAYTVRSKISADGKTLTTNVKGTTAAGQTVAGTNVYTKQ